MKLKTIILLWGVMISGFASAQNDLIMSQYIHNRYAINPSFAGCREALSLFGSYRMQMMGIENTPRSILFTAHTSLKKEVILGLTLYNQTIHQSMNTGGQLAIGYRFHTGAKSFFALALNPGVAYRSSDWTKVKTTEEGDESFAEKTDNITPLLGFGIAWYGKQFFLGVGISSFFNNDDFDRTDIEFNADEGTFTATGGYLFQAGVMGIQPSVLASYQKEEDFRLDGTISLIYDDFVWIDAGYRTTNEVTVGVAIQPLKQLRIAYNYDINMSDAKSYTSGSHEISLQYEFLYKTKNVGPRFF